MMRPGQPLHVWPSTPDALEAGRKDASIVPTSLAVIHLYGVDRNSTIDHINFQLNAANAFDGPSPGKE
jgi:hypothetical protein